MEEQSKAKIKWQELAVWLATEDSRGIRITYGSNHDPQRHLLLAAIRNSREIIQNQDQRSQSTIGL